MTKEKTMKIELSDGRNTQVIDKYFAGVDTYDNPHGGKFAVKQIKSLTILSDGSLYLIVEFLPAEPSADAEMPTLKEPAVIC